MAVGDPRLTPALGVEARRPRRAFVLAATSHVTFGSGGPPKGGGLGPGPINYSDANPADFLPALGSSLRRGVRPGSISRCSRIPNHWQSGSTSAEPRAPTAG